MHGGSGGGVAYGAHIGGFIAGLILVKLFLIGVYSKGRLSFP
jgi:membrane associated rhomboid family serine protease